MFDEDMTIVFEVKVPSADGGRHVAVRDLHAAVQSIMGDDPSSLSSLFAIRDLDSGRVLDDTKEPDLLVSSSRPVVVYGYRNVGPLAKYMLEKEEGLQKTWMPFKVFDQNVGSRDIPRGLAIPRHMYPPHNLLVVALTGAKTRDMVLVNPLDIWEALGRVPVKIVVEDCGVDILPEDTFILFRGDRGIDEIGRRMLPTLLITYDSQYDAEAVGSARRYNRVKHWLRAVNAASKREESPVPPHPPKVLPYD